MYDREQVSQAVGYTDRELHCRDCRNPFLFTAGEQDFFGQRGLQDPVRCKGCRALKKAQREGTAGASPVQAYPAPRPPTTESASRSRPVVTDVSSAGFRGKGEGGSRGRGGNPRKSRQEQGDADAFFRQNWRDDD